MRSLALVLLVGCGPSSLELQARHAEYERGRTEALEEVQNQLDDGGCASLFDSPPRNREK